MCVCIKTFIILFIKCYFDIYVIFNIYRNETKIKNMKSKLSVLNIYKYNL